MKVEYILDYVNHLEKEPYRKVMQESESFLFAPVKKEMNSFGLVPIDKIQN